MNVSTFLFMSEPIPDPVAVGAVIETAPEDIAVGSEGGFFTVMKNVFEGEEKETTPASERVETVSKAGHPVDSSEANSGDAAIEGLSTSGPDSPGRTNPAGWSGNLEAILQMMVAAAPSERILVEGAQKETDITASIIESGGETVSPDANGTSLDGKHLSNRVPQFNGPRPIVNHIVGAQMEAVLPETKIHGEPAAPAALKTGESTDRIAAPIVVQERNIAETGDRILVEKLGTNGRGELRQTDTMDIKGANEIRRADMSSGRHVSENAVAAKPFRGETVIRAGARSVNSTVARIDSSGLKEAPASSSTGETVVRDAAAHTDRRDMNAVHGVQGAKAEGAAETKSARLLAVNKTDFARTEEPTENTTTAKGRDGFARAASDIRSIRLSETTAQRPLAASATDFARTEESAQNTTAVKGRDGFARAASETRSVRLTETPAERPLTASATDFARTEEQAENTMAVKGRDGFARAASETRSVRLTETPAERPLTASAPDFARTEEQAENTTAVKGRDGLARAASNITSTRFTETAAQAEKGEATLVDKTHTRIPETKGVEVRAEISGEKADVAGVKRESTPVEAPKLSADSKPLENAGAFAERKSVSREESPRVVSKPVVHTVEKVVEKVVSTPVQRSVSAGTTVGEEVRVDVKRTTVSAGTTEAAKPGDAPVVTEDRVITRVKRVAAPVSRETSAEKLTVPDGRMAKTEPVESVVSTDKVETPAGPAVKIDTKADIPADLSAKAEPSVNRVASAQTGPKRAADLPAKSAAKADASVRADFSIGGRVPVHAAASETRSESVTPEMRALRESVLEQLSNETRSLSKDGAKEVEISLDPPELGKLKLKLMVEGTSVRGLIEVESHAVKAALQSDLTRLSAALAENGLDLGRFDVFVADDRNRGGDREYEQLPGRFSRDAEEKTPEDGESRDQPQKRSGNSAVDYWM